MKDIFANKKLLFLMIGLVMLLGLILIVRAFMTPRPAPSDREFPVFSATPLPTPSFTPEESLPYNNEQITKDFERITANAPLSPADAEARNNLLEITNNNSGIIRETPTYIIEYVKNANQFLIEIKSEAAENAKQEALNWLKTQGLSNQGICNLPVVLYLSFDVKSFYQENNLTFNIIPDGC